MTPNNSNMASSSGFWKPAPPSLQSAVRDDGQHDGEHATGLFQRRRNVSIARQRMLLPIYKHKRQITYALERYGCVVIVGETGSGKSTQIPQYLLEAGWAQHGFQIVITQPRRVAAISLAQRVAEEMDTSLKSQLVGYTVRFDDQSTTGVTQIKFVTDGILLSEATLHDPLLSRYSCIIIDEAHERSLNTDVLLGLIKQIRKRRKDLRVLICSATIVAEKFLNYFVKNKPDQDEGKEKTAKRSRWRAKVEDWVPSEHGTIISVDGRQHAVENFYAEKPVPNYVEACVETCWNIHTREGPGSVLCFLPTEENVDRAIQMAEQKFHTETTQVEFVPLYGSLPLYMQAKIFQPPANEKLRRLIFSTNISETSITVPNVSFVVDAGLVKLPYYDPITAMERLIEQPTSQASARQRAGRAGRVQSGKCFRLYTEDFYAKKMQAQTLPEIERTNLTSLVLTLKSLGVSNVLEFDFMDMPSMDSISHALETLYALGAMDAKTNLTPLGLDLSKFPTEPRVSRMLLESLVEGCSWEVLAVAGALQVRDLFQKPRSRNQQKLLDYNESVGELADPSGDHVTFANLLSEVDDRQWSEEECRERFSK